MSEKFRGNEELLAEPGSEWYGVGSVIPWLKSRIPSRRRASQVVMSVTTSTRWDEVAKRIQQGDASAEEELARFFRPRLLLLATVRLRNTQWADDIAQESLLASLQAVRNGHLRNPEKLEAFVLGVARNLINNHARQASRHPCAVPADVPSPDGDAFRRTQQEEEIRLVVRVALKSLDAVDAQILMLTLVESMTPREIASVVGLQPELVRTRKSRAIKKIVEHVKKASRNRLLNHK